jgi:hypothetical protein
VNDAPARFDWRALACLTLAFGGGLHDSVIAQNRGSTISLVDLPAYREALEGAPDAPAISVRFRDLWDHQPDYQGRRVRVEGRIERIFRQPAIGDFPALSEAWLIEAGGDPICIVFPTQDSPPLGSQAMFEGDFLRQIRYFGGDTERLAPLVVGPGVPRAVESARVNPTLPAVPIASDRLDWLFGTVALLLVVVGLLRVFAKSPPMPSRRAECGPDPMLEFLDGDDAATPPAEPEFG